MYPLTAAGEVDQQEMLEERAQQLEQAGKPQLAAALRKNALGVDHDNPGARGHAILSQLSDKMQPESMPAMLTDQSREQCNREPDSQPKRRRRATRRTSSKPSQSAGDKNDA